MSEDKLSSGEVPQKFTEWLLAMGCPPENVPPIEKVVEMCRGQYYMVWRSLMEKVEPKNIIKNKRLQVFCDDIKRSQKISAFSEQHRNVVIPEELSLWRQHSQLKEKVADAETRVATEKETLHHLIDKISSKFSQRVLSRKRLQDAQRRAWLLQHVLEELKTKKVNLEETKIIADSFCGFDEGADIENKLLKCVQNLLSRSPVASVSDSRSGASMLSAANHASSSVSTYTENNDDEIMSSVVKCRGDVLFKQLYEKRAGLYASMPTTLDNETVEFGNSVTPQSVLAHTSSLHCNLALEAMKNGVHINRTTNKLASAVSELSNYLTGEACELLVVRCEKACTEARMATMRALCDEVISRSGIFSTGNHQAQDSVASTHIESVDRNIKSKKDELNKLVTSVATIELKTQNVKECLASLFNSFHTDGLKRDNDKFGARSSLPAPSISTIRQFYEEKCDKRKNKMELSMDFDVSDKCSFNDITENSNPMFADELKLFLKKFNLEQNRNLVLKSGEKVWIFETLNSSLLQLLAKWQNDDIITSLISPSHNLKYNLQRIQNDCEKKAELETMVLALEEDTKKCDFGLDALTESTKEEKVLDKIKKQLNENIISLQKTGKALDINLENIHLWSENGVKKHISNNRTVNGMTYLEYEKAYLENVLM